MIRKEFLQEIATRSGYGYEETEHFYMTLVAVMADVLAQGETVACIEDWGQFIPKLHDNPGRNVNSPRRERNPHYYIQFKPGKKFERVLFTNLKKL